MMHDAWCMVHDARWWKMTFSGRWPLVEDDLWWKMTFSGRRPLVEDDLRWKTTFVGSLHAAYSALQHFLSIKSLQIYWHERAVHSLCCTKLWIVNNSHKGKLSPDFRTKIVNVSWGLKHKMWRKNVNKSCEPKIWTYVVSKNFVTKNPNKNCGHNYIRCIPHNQSSVFFQIFQGATCAHAILLEKISETL